MKTLKQGSTGEQVKTLQNLLGVTVDGIFGPGLCNKVIEYQKTNSLDPDGIVGYNTWKSLFLDLRGSSSGSITESDYKTCALLLDCEVASIKAVKKVETAGNTGFLDNGKPTILFEGHVFWSELKKKGINPSALQKGNYDILYPTWTKKYYKGGIEEWTRLERARRISRDAANSSASWGLFQIMGNNYKSCGSSSIDDFVDNMSKGSFMQLLMFCNFIHNNTNLLKALQQKDWATFARIYNGSGYKQNKYDIKLKQAYNVYC